MHRAMYFVLAITISAPAHASSFDPDQFCTLISKTAAEMMKSRQHDMPMTRLIEALPQVDATLRPLARTLILEAYQRPAFRTEENKQHEIVEFANKASLDCYKGLVNIK